MKRRTKLWLMILFSAVGSVVLFLTLSTLTGGIWNQGYNLKKLNAISQESLTAIEQQDAFSGPEVQLIMEDVLRPYPEIRLEWLAEDGSTIYDTAGETNSYDFRQLADRVVHMPDNLWSTDDTITLAYSIAHDSRSYYLLLSLSGEDMQSGQMYFFLRTYKALLAFVLPLLLALLLPYLLSLWFFSSTDRRIRKLNAALNQVGIRSDVIVLEDKSRDEIGQLTRHYNSMAKRIRSQSSQIEQFQNRRRQLLSNLSHDLRTPLTMILGYAETIRTGAYKDENELQSGAKIILQRSRYMDKLLDQLLDIARHEEYVLRPQLAMHNLSELMRKVAADYLLFLDGKNVVVEADIQDADVEVMIDAPLIERALRNLLDNAVRYGEGGHYLGIGLTEDEEDVILSVKDRGKGIAPEDRERIFERFYRADEGRKGEGLGIGLSIVKEIAESHHGSIRLLDAAMTETVFQIRLPKKPPSEAASG
ncbi:sensor histidine kinase [Paenibacillus mendelii]|uniref:histidine kinase n=1 Tax=Paenibacillus mendelii TaxID=206163 RepID=A0ABV6J470_9BACL|nr:HAMP domain-containing sensor histidine kinase [Paenibacillus mendelii]MCQ6561799.1 HAMP domain-containing histidine kinase [Paenibacillus mendelii]